MYVNSFQCFDIPYCTFDFLSHPGRSDNGEPGYTNYFHDASLLGKRSSAVVGDAGSESGMTVFELRFP